MVADLDSVLSCAVQSWVFFRFVLIWEFLLLLFGCFYFVV